jgi:hypothetical protein
MGALERPIEPETRDDPESPLCWTCKGTRTLAAQLTRHKHPARAGSRYTTPPLAAEESGTRSATDGIIFIEAVLDEIAIPFRRGSYP